VVSVKYIDTFGVEQTLVQNTDYVVDTYGIVGHVRPAYGVGWPTARDDFNTVKIRYTCGYGPAATDVPDLIREAIILMVGHWMNFQPAAESGSITRVPYAVRDLLDRFTVYKFV
jgi:uncharacterized phiE125 gp8 family phage protein